MNVSRIPQKITLVPCPSCRGESVYAATNPYRPFCSERCRLVDLGLWAQEGFRLEVSDDLSEEK